MLPVGLAAPFTFNIPHDYSGGDGTSFSEKVTEAVKAWFTAATPSTTGALFRFDVSVFSSLNDTNLPLLRLRNLVLETAYIQDL
jgi:hypothetical protein